MPGHLNLQLLTELLDTCPFNIVIMLFAKSVQPEPLDLTGFNGQISVCC